MLWRKSLASTGEHSRSLSSSTLPERDKKLQVCNASYITTEFSDFSQPDNFFKNVLYWNKILVYPTQKPVKVFFVLFSLFPSDTLVYCLFSFFVCSLLMSFNGCTLG